MPLKEKSKWGRAGAGPRSLRSRCLSCAAREVDRHRIAVLRQGVDERSAGVAESEQLGDLVEGFSGGIVAGVSDVLVTPLAPQPPKCMLAGIAAETTCSAR